MINLLLVDVGDYLRPETVRQIKEQNQIDTLYMIVNKEEWLTQYQSLGCCLVKKTLVKGKYEVDEADSKKAIPLDDKIFSSFYPYLLQIFYQQRRFEQHYDGLDISPTLSNHYDIFIHNLYYLYNQIIKWKITHVFFPTIPHLGYETIIFYLCKMLGIPTIMFFWSLLPDREYAMKDFMEDYAELEAEYLKLKRDFEGVDIDDIPLDVGAQKCFDNWSSLDEKKMVPYYMHGNKFKITLRGRYAETNVINLWRGILGKEYEKYGIGIRFLGASILKIPELMKQFPVAYRRYRYAHPYKKQAVEMRKFYESMCVNPQEGERYIYFPLHYQPEATSNPIAGEFYYDQRIPLNIMAKSVPEDIKIYVKIHPDQIAFFCTIDYLKDMLKIPNVRFMNAQVSTYDLMSKAIAVSSISGTACWECQFFGVPAILFGYSYKNITPLAYPVRTWEDCKKAVNDILTREKKDVLKELKLFVKAVYNTSFSTEDREGNYLRNIKRLLDM